MDSLKIVLALITGDDDFQAEQGASATAVAANRLNLGSSMREIDRY
jgi:hypothetical protein